MTIEPECLGVVWQWPGAAGEFRLRGERAAEAVEVQRRVAPEQAWQPVCRVVVEDRADEGILRIAVTPAGGEAVEEVVRYDPDTGRPEVKGG